jgi:hypothetical protein
MSPETPPHAPHTTKEAPEFLGSSNMDPARTNPGLPIVGREHMEATNPIGQGAPPGGDTDYEAIARGSSEGLNPQNVDTMHRGEDDPAAFEASPEFHDRKTR